MSSYTTLPALREGQGFYKNSDSILFQLWIPACFSLDFEKVNNLNFAPFFQPIEMKHRMTFLPSLYPISHDKYCSHLKLIEIFG